MEMNQIVYGLFRYGTQAVIQSGEISSTRQEQFTVEFTGFHYTYNHTDIGKCVFLTPEEADEAAARFEHNVRCGFYE